MSSPAAAIRAPEYSETERRLITLTVALGSISIILTTTIINVVIPIIMGAFGVGQDKAQWLTTGNIAAMTTSMLLSDWFVRRLGRRWTYIAALGLFMTGSIVAGNATSYDMLIFGRVVQGISAGVSQPLAMGTLFTISPAGRQGRAMGMFGMIVVFGPSLGPFIGGLAADAFSWRYVFFVPLPFTALAAMMALLFMPTRAPGDAPRPAFDWIGYALLVTFVMCLLIGLSSGLQDGWYSDRILSLFAASAIALATFIGWELTRREPLLNLRLFTVPSYAAAVTVSFAIGAGLMGTLYLVPIFVQLVQGYTPTKAGLLQMPAGLVMAMMMPLAGRIVDRGLAPLLYIGGLSLAAFSGVLMTGAHIDTAFWVFAGWLIMNRLGQSMIFTSLNTTSLQSLPPHLVGQGAGANNFIRSIGGAFGVNILAITVEQQTQTYRQVLLGTQNAGNPQTLEFLDEVRELLGTAGLPETLQDPMALYYLNQTVLHQANMLAFRDGFMLYALVMMVAIIPALFVKRRRREGAAMPRGAAAAPGD